MIVKMEKIKKSLKSLRFKLFLTLSIVVVIIIGVLIILNNIILETYYEHNRRNTLKMTYEQINNYYNMSISTKRRIRKNISKQ